MSFYYFMKLSIALCSGYSASAKVSCVDLQTKCYEKFINSKTWKSTDRLPLECFKLNKAEK